MNYPKITAVMVTLGRMPLVLESYSYFKKQTYPNKELLIVTDGEKDEHNSLKQLAKKDRQISVLHVDGPRKTLGELRNLSLRFASDLSIQWDDDDWYGPTRIMDQWQGLKDGKAVMLREQLHYFRDTNEVAWIVDETGIQGTLLLDKRCGVTYPRQKTGEDTVVKNDLLLKHMLRTVPGGICYCRTYHGHNTWDLKHHLERIKKYAKPKNDIDVSELAKAAKLYGWKKGWKLIGA